VAGLAALIISQYPTLTNVEVRRLIERTAEKTGTTAYADTPGYDSGSWNQDMGYGRINCFRALDEADVMIRDWSGDDGTEPSSPPAGISGASPTSWYDLRRQRVCADRSRPVEVPRAGDRTITSTCASRTRARARHGTSPCRPG
jgi:hypothetical protein